jgi:hypothetical protein
MLTNENSNKAKIGIISFPRSGSHLVSSIISSMYMYTMGHFSFCEFYTCCKQVPCNKCSILCKNHDFQLNLQKNLYEKIVVLYRKEPVESIDAYIRYEKSINKYAVDYDAVAFEKDVAQKLVYYKRFLEKWVNHEDENIFKISYEDMLSNTYQTIDNLRTFLLNDSYLNMSNYQQELYQKHLTSIILNSFKISKKSEIELKNCKVIKKIIHSMHTEKLKHILL